MTFNKRLARAYRAFMGRPVGRTAPAGGRNADARRDYYFLGPDLALTRLTNGLLLYVDPQDETMSAHMIANGYWETWIYSRVVSLISPGDTVIEVGANVGYYTTAMAAAVGPTGSVVAFEANQRLADLVTRSIHINGFSERATLIPKAAMDTTGETDFVTSRRQSGYGYATIWETTHHDDAVVNRVQTMRLDDLDLARVDLIRMDAEGSEPAVLRGAEQILIENPGIVVCTEWSATQFGSRTSLAEFIDWLVGLGFRFWKIEFDSSLTALNVSDLMRIDNCDVVISRNQLPA